MCQRYSFILSREDIRQELRYLDCKVDMPSSYNIVPGQHAPVVASDKPHEIQYLRWGLIPEAATNRNIRNLINARAEGISTAISFRMPLREKRCLVLADSFYAWQQRGTYAAPFRIQHRTHKVMVFAGVWDIWQKEDGGLIKSFAIITKPASEPLSNITNRIPLILDEPAVQQNWLGQLPFGKVMDIVQQDYRNDLSYYQIPDSINSLTYNSWDLHDEVLNPQPKFNDL